METVKPFWNYTPAKDRKSTADRRYKTQAWKSYSELFRRKNPLCIVCQAKGIVSPSQCVDHIIRVNFGGSFLDPRNHQPMCDQCHRDKSYAERNGLSLPYQLNDKGDKIPFDRGGISLIDKYSLPTPQVSCRASDVKTQRVFYHGGTIAALHAKLRYQFPYFFGTSQKIHALHYSKLNKGKLYAFECTPDLTLNFDGLTNSGEYLALIYEIGSSPYKVTLIQNCIDFGVKSDFVLVTDFDRVSNLVRV
jgi:5-methylcytosine-specific restriction enzyme A